MSAFELLMMNNICKKCEILYSSQKTREEILKTVDKLPPEDRADEKTAEARIDVCLSCDRLSGETCLACGCYVEFRTALKSGSCPKGKWRAIPQRESMR